MVTSQLKSQPLFTSGQLKKLIFPLVIEQLLSVTVGMADTIMITTVGEAAVSGISLVDNISLLLIQLMAALCTGGAVIAAQYLGRRDEKNARHSARQLLLSVTALSLLLMGIALIFNKSLLRLIFGNIEADVMRNAEIYFMITALSYPALAIYSACAALFRSMGNSKVSMVCALVMNLINISGNAALIYGLKFGVEGAAIPTLLSRTAAAIIMLVLIRNPENPIFINRLLKIRFDWNAIKMVLKIGLPNGVENSVFQVGKLLVQSIITTFGTAAIAANAIVGSVTSLMMVPGSAIGLALITVVGQCRGAGEFDQLSYYVRKLMKLIYICVAVLSVSMFFISPHLMKLFRLSEEALAIATTLTTSYCILYPIFWPMSFPFANVLRAAGDVKFTMIVSLVTMWCCRIALSYVFAYALGYGVLGVWLAMYADWMARGAIFYTRYRRGRWKQKVVIAE